VGVYSTSSALALIFDFTLLREGDGVGSAAESESEITSWKQNDEDVDSIELFSAHL
jgi:hypothetical protein